VLVMYAGKIVEEAPVKKLYRDPRHPYTRGLLNSVPVIGRKFETGRRLQEIPGTIPGPLDMPPGCRFSPRCEKSMSICNSQEPPMFRLSEDRRVSCWLEKKSDGGKSTETARVGD
jgi:peptide/nickel transport system ATP-binding protein